ncbi:uncharacterized protein LY89DRAFT_334957 [Mollisia scopiformis]|uniref:Uncharacterized protein n=1 Tax=Mollisia scopiformis TaxID=149040 RepID=A0A132B874_MOLSC|nr:uncharacterized protein LY89DRAFT_334957 [Mollisia scopiformis]KUJ08608.1 hypothetical protein LY89DRAFT_334957 [Mollisia scopiformis]
MSSSKGKSPATGDEDGELNNSEDTAEPSFLSRVAASASGLTRSAFGSPGGNELNEQAAAALSNAGKGQSSTRTPGESSWAEGSKLVQSPSQPPGRGSSGLRVGQSEAHVRQSENEFSDFLDGIDSFSPSTESANSQVGEVPNGFKQVWAHSQITPQPLHGERLAGTVAEQESQDGQGVLDLLSGPASLHEPFEAPEEDEEFYDWGLSQDQIIELRAMLKDILPPLEQHTGVAADNPLNLVPNSNEYNKAQWFEEWDGVLNRYADEVWGGLLPLVKDARKELDDIRNGEVAAEQPKALRRLNAILGHLQKRYH